jgi:hypothetical protein
MIAQDVLLGRPTARPRTASVDAAREGGGAARAVLQVLFVSVIALESITADPLLAIGTYIHRGIGSWTGLPVLLTPLEILLIVGVVIAVASASVEHREGEASILGWPTFLFLTTVVLGIARGMLANGDMYVGLWEVRYLLYVPACFVIARTSLRRPEHVFSLLRVGLIAATVFGVEGVWRKLALINTGLLGVNPERYFEHDDVIFLATFLILALSAFVFRVPGRIRILGACAAPVLFYTLLASNRRAGIIVVLVGLLVVALTLLVVKRRAFFASTLPILVATCVFFALTWNASGVLGQPARAVRSLYEPDARDASSNVYRLIETYDISATLQEDPILGVGFGRPFHMVVPLPDLSWWPFWHYETHNNVLWIWLKTGVAGYVAFWVLMGTAMSRAAFGARNLRDQGLRMAALVGLVALVGIIVYGWVDLAFVSGRTTVFLGTMLGMLGVLERLDRATVRGARGVS